MTFFVINQTQLQSHFRMSCEQSSIYGYHNRTELDNFSLFKKKAFVGHIHMSYFRATFTPVMDFWWRLL